MALVQSYDDEHDAFAASRVSQYVYVPAKDSFFTTLDQHADTLEGDVKLPLLLLGDEGSGKSALLANWVARRRDHKHKDEFLFQHYVGCSTPSLQLAHTLFRLETALKDFFQLREMKVPETEVELRWSLNRFLAAAAKKMSPARIVIIIDGINRLKAEDAPDGSLHWLPTELPPCVRFIVSSVEFERIPRGSFSTPAPHRTHVELVRRQCPLLRMEPLGIQTRHSIINLFIQLNEGNSATERLELGEPQIHKIITANVTSQPMYLRELLQAIRIASILTTFTIDQMLDTYLACGTAGELIDTNLNLCCEAIFGTNGSEEEYSIFGKVFSMIYVSRNGLTQDEIWGVMKLMSKIQTDEETEEKLFSVLTEFTMVVKNMHSFSHELYREMVFEKYIRSHEALTRLHYLMARYFGQLPPCARKLVALPYHLEVAGSWSKVKNCLTDIEMFQLWWTPPFKGDFIKFWVSLTKQIPSTNKQHGKKTGKKKGMVSNSTEERGGGGGEVVDLALAKRPSYDIVEEYVKSLDEYIDSRHPSDEVVANIVLEIGDFLLEFASLGYEQAADVPSNVHPRIPSEDLASIGVPHIVIDEDGRSTLIYPAIYNMGAIADDGTGLAENAPTKATDDLPLCTTYFFERWMWIQFPLIALGNCDDRYNLGIQKFQESNTDVKGSKRGIGEERSTVSAGSDRRKRIPGATATNKDLNKSWSSDSLKLPELKFTRKAARTTRRLTPFDLKDESKVAADKFTQRLVALQDDIQNYREEYDFVCQMRNGLVRRVAELSGSLEELKRSAESTAIFDGRLQEAIKNESEASEKEVSVVLLRRNLGALSLMCDRHPPKVPALIQETENKIELDKVLLAEIKKRLWEQRFEKQSHHSKFRQMKQIVQEGVEMHNKLLEYRYMMKKRLQRQASDDQRRLTSGSTSSDSLQSKKSRKLLRGSPDKSQEAGEEQQLMLTDGSQNWDEVWSVISARTGIIEPEIFFSRLNNGKVLENQIIMLKLASEARLESLKKELGPTEVELEETRYEASFAGVQSSKEQKKELLEKQGMFRHTKERSEGAQQLVKQVIGGLKHIADSLGLPPKEDDVPAGDLLRDIEAVLETLMEEREKQQQQQQQVLHGHTQSQQGSDSPARLHGTRDNVQNPETHSHRSPELESVLLKYETPKARLPSVLPSKADDKATEGGSISASEREEVDEDDEEGTWDRTFVKSQSLKNVKAELKKAARQSKIESDAQLAATL